MHIIIRSLSFLIVSIYFSFSAYAQDILHFDAAHIIGTGNNIIVHRVPVTNSQTNEVILKDVTVEFGVAPDGTIAVVNITSADSVPLPNSANNIIPGEYVSNTNISYLVSVGGTTADGRTSINVRSTSDNGIFDASYLTGPVEGHLFIGTIPIAAELADGPIYGVMGESSFIDNYCEGGLSVISQIDTTITLFAFHISTRAGLGCVFENTNFPVSSFTLIRIPEETQ